MLAENKQPKKDYRININAFQGSHGIEICRKKWEKGN